MIYAIAFSSFAIGFSFATLLLCRVSLRPQAKKVLQQARLLPLHKAKTPKLELIREEYLDLDEE